MPMVTLYTATNTTNPTRPIRIEALPTDLIHPSNTPSTLTSNPAPTPATPPGPIVPLHHAGPPRGSTTPPKGQIVILTPSPHQLKGDDHLLVSPPYQQARTLATSAHTPIQDVPPLPVAQGPLHRTSKRQRSWYPMVLPWAHIPPHA